MIRIRFLSASSLSFIAHTSLLYLMLQTLVPLKNQVAEESSFGHDCELNLYLFLCFTLYALSIVPVIHIVKKICSLFSRFCFLLIYVILLV